MGTMERKTDAKKEKARERVRQYAANMAVEGIELSDRDWKVIESCIEEGLSAEETRTRIVESLRADGIILGDTEPTSNQ